MSAFSGQFNWAEGLIWQVAIVASDAEDPNQGRLRLCTALVDTGASHTSITQSVAQQLQLEPSGKIDLQTASGLVSVNLYDVKLGFLIPMKKDDDGNVQGQVQVMEKTIRAPEFDAGKSGYQVLIGRDILSNGILTLSHDGHYSFSY